MLEEERVVLLPYPTGYSLQAVSMISNVVPFLWPWGRSEQCEATKPQRYPVDIADIVLHPASRTLHVKHCTCSGTRTDVSKQQGVTEDEICTIVARS